MQTANILVALGGDLGNTVPKENVPASEIAVLRAIHGADAIIDVEPTGEIEVSSRAEIHRLKGIYANAKDREGRPHVENLYPGAGARVVETIDDLGLSPEQFKATSRAGKGVVEPEVELPPVKPVRKIKAKTTKKAEEDILD